MGNMDTQVDQIVRGRAAAAEFCEKAAGLFSSAKPALLTAAKAYRKEVAIARAAFAPFIPAFNGNDGPRVAWHSDESKRQSGVAAIQQMLESERAAIAAIEEALVITGFVRAS